jgi:hypothetical protein
MMPGAPMAEFEEPGAAEGFFLVNGKYVVPSSVEVVPIEANKSFKLNLKTSEGDLNLTIKCWGWDPPLYEHWATCEGTFNGQNLTNGYAWLEHIPQGGMNASPPEGGRKGLPEKQ